MKRRFVTALAVAALSQASPAWSQQSAESMVRDEMARRGVTSGFSVETGSRDIFDQSLRDSGFGLVLDRALVWSDDGDGWSLTVVVQNFTDSPWCIRPNVENPPKAQTLAIQTTNQIVQPGASIPIMVAASQYGSVQQTMRITIAYWSPNYDAPEGSYCRSVAPPGLADWTTQSGARDLEGD